MHRNSVVSRSRLERLNQRVFLRQRDFVEPMSNTQPVLAIDMELYGLSRKFRWFVEDGGVELTNPFYSSVLSNN